MPTSIATIYHDAYNRSLIKRAVVKALTFQKRFYIQVIIPEQDSQDSIEEQHDGDTGANTGANSESEYADESTDSFIMYPEDDA